MYPVSLPLAADQLIVGRFLWAQKPFFIFYTNAQGLHFHTVNLHFYGDEPILYARESSVDFALDTFLKCIYHYEG